MRHILIFFLIIFIGCSPEKQLNKLKLNHPELVSKKAAEWYPCLTVSTSVDSTLYKKWMASIDSINNLYVNYKPDVIKIIDTVEVIDSANCIKCSKDLYLVTMRLVKANNTIYSLNKKIFNAPIIHDTIVKIDSARLKNYSEQISRLEKEKDAYSRKNERALWMSISFLVALIISVIINIIQFKK